MVDELESLQNPYATPEHGEDLLAPANRRVRSLIIVGMSTVISGLVGGVIGYSRLSWRWPRDLTMSAITYFGFWAAVIGFFVSTLYCVFLIMDYRSSHLRSIRSRRSELLAEVRDRASRNSRKSP
jgi:hypothetical protein